MRTILLFLACGLAMLTFSSAYAGTPPFDSCYNHPDPSLCGFTSNPFSAILDYFDQLIPGFATLLLWGPIIFGLWYKTQKAEIAGFAGIVIVATVTSIHPQGVAIGMLLVAVSLGISFIGIFQRIKQTA